MLVGCVENYLRKGYWAMQLGDLSKWGIPSRIIELWRQRQGEALLSVQSRAIRKGLLGENDRENGNDSVRMLISAPTSSGKSFCAEMAMVKALVSRRKTVLLFPLKSLAEQTYRLYNETYAPLGVKCLIATGDHPENDRRFREGDYQVAIAIYEKFNLLLTESLDALKNTGLIVLDEIQTVAEPGRGALLELLITKILASVYEPSLVALSAVIGDSERSAGCLADWLGATLVEESTRPVDLIRGVAAEGSFRFRSYNDGTDGCQEFVRIEAGDDPFECFVRQLKIDSGPTLVFLKSRADTVRYAFKLASSVGWDEAKTALARLSGEEPSYLIRSLSQALGRGVAFHNSDLSPYQRKIIEEGFVRGEIKTVFSTTTLAMGVNLPAETVYLETAKYSSGEYNGRPSLVPVSRSEFDNMTGRAGRLGLQDGSKPGRAIILAESEFDREILWENYIATEKAEPIKSAFETMPLADWLLNLIVTFGHGVSGLFQSTLYAAVEGMTGQSLTGQGGRSHEFTGVNPQDLPQHCVETSSTCPKGLAPSNVEREMAYLVAHGFVCKKDISGTTISGDDYFPTALGQAVARTGLPVAAAVCYLDKLDTDRPETPFGWTALALSSPHWVLPPGILSRSEQRHNMPLKSLYQLFDDRVTETRFLIGHDYQREPLPYRVAASLKALLLLDEWSRLTPVRRLEERYQLHLGQIMHLGETAGHLVASLATLITAIDAETLAGRQLSALAFSFRTGLPITLQELHQHLGNILNRSDFAALQKAGINILSDLADTPVTELAQLIKGDYKLKQITDKLQTLKEEINMSLHGTTSAPRLDVNSAVASVVPELVEIDGSPDGERYLVRINGFPIKLTGKSFKYFAKLACSRAKGDAGWIYKEDIEVGFNQARYLYRMKNEVGASLNFAWPMIENNRLGYYRLNVDPAKIQINLDNLRSHPDYEVRILVGDQTPGTVN